MLALRAFGLLRQDSACLLSLNYRLVCFWIVKTGFGLLVLLECNELGRWKVQSLVLFSRYCSGCRHPAN